ncbi:MAG: hypothetical protein CNB62_01520 [Pelagibacterales bacterium MED-G44]|nr:MAG: hypothetical protein CNB62_01520 [Pelagibacterales bacterium MED-G44]
MKNKFFLFFLLFLFLSNCGYKPIYSTKNLNFTIENIEKSNTSLNNKFEKSINALKKRESDKKINIKFESEKKIKIKSKDTKGNALVFEIEIYLKFASTNIDSQREKLFSRKITYNNSDDKFKLKKYEDELEDILITKIVEDLINYLSSI